MKRVSICLLAICALQSCGNDEFTKDHSGSFKADGVEYSATADNVTASYVDDSTLNVTFVAGQSSTYSVSLWINLNKAVDQPVPIVFGSNEGFVYYHENSADAYQGKIGLYTITGHEEGNPASRHTEGVFNFRAVNSDQDTISLTDGKFYVNNY